MTFSTAICSATATTFSTVTNSAQITFTVAVITGICACASACFMFATGLYRLIPAVVALGTAMLTEQATGGTAGMLAGLSAFGTQKIGLKMLEILAVERDETIRVFAPARRLTWLAALLSGHRWAGGYQEWVADLDGIDGSGLDRKLRQLRFSCGYVAAGVKSRMNDAAEWLGDRLDWIVSSQQRIFVASTMGVGFAISVLIFENKNLSSVIANSQNLVILGGGIWTGGSFLRKIRQPSARQRSHSTDKPPKSPPSRKRENVLDNKTTPRSAKPRRGRTKRNRRR